MATTILTEDHFTFKNGDIKILVKLSGKQAVVMVSSHAITLASLVWMKFAFPPPFCKPPNVPTRKNRQVRCHTVSRVIILILVQENQSNLLPQAKAQQIDFSEDDSSALMILLQIAHLHFDSIPSLDYHTLLNIALLCDQYDCVKLVKPWLSQWCSNEDEQCLVVGQEKWLFIAWVFGREQVFENLSRALVSLVGRDNDGNMTNGKGYIIGEMMPDGIVGQSMSNSKSAHTY
jgi:hypothetical protein